MKNNMKRTSIVLITSVALISILLSGCEFLASWREAILNKFSKTAENAGYQYEKTKMSVENKVNQVEEAAQKVQDAAQKVKEAAAEIEAAKQAVTKVGQ